MIGDRRITVVVGHYGSGKTEFAINYAIKLAEKGKKVAIADLDIVNPYFRSREKKHMMRNRGITVIGSSIEESLCADLPALSPSVISPILDKSYNVILDIGGDATGAKILARYKKYIDTENYDMLCIVNANRPETRDVEGINKHIKEIECMTGMKITGLVNNTHFLKDTLVKDVKNGQRIVENVADKLKVPIRYVCANQNIFNRVTSHVDSEVLPIHMHMREDWMQYR